MQEEGQHSLDNPSTPPWSVEPIPKKRKVERSPVQPSVPSTPLAQASGGAPDLWDGNPFSISNPMLAGPESLLRGLAYDHPGERPKDRRRVDVAGTPVGRESADRAQEAMRNRSWRHRLNDLYDLPVCSITRQASTHAPGMVHMAHMMSHSLAIKEQMTFKWRVALGHGDIDFNVDTRLNGMTIRADIHVMIDQAVVTIVPDFDEFKPVCEAILLNLVTASKDVSRPWTEPAYPLVPENFDTRMPRKGWTYRLVGLRADDHLRIMRHGLTWNMDTGRFATVGDTFETFSLNKRPFLEFTALTSPAFVFAKFYEQWEALNENCSQSDATQGHASLPSWWFEQSEIAKVSSLMLSLAATISTFEPKEGVAQAMRGLDARARYSTQEPRKRFRSWRKDQNVMSTLGEIFGTKGGELAGGVTGASPSSAFNPLRPRDIGDECDTDEESSDGSPVPAR